MVLKKNTPILFPHIGSPIPQARIFLQPSPRGCAGASRARPSVPRSSMARGNLGVVVRSPRGSDGRATTERGNHARRTDRKKIPHSPVVERDAETRVGTPVGRSRGSSHEPATTGIIVQRESSHREITRTSRKRRGNKRYRCVDDRAIRCTRKLNVKESNRTARRSVAREED